MQSTSNGNKLYYMYKLLLLFSNINLLKTKHNLLHNKESDRNAQQTLSTTVIKTSQLMMHKAKDTLFWYPYKTLNAKRAHVELLNVKPGGT